MREGEAIRPAALDNLMASFSRDFGIDERRLVLARAQGRTELAGNHTDHQHGKTVAATIDRGLVALAAENGTDLIRVTSDGFTSFEIHTAHRKPETDERISTKGLVRGMVAGMENSGYEVRGFDLCVTGDLPAGAGLSSSAAFELMVGSAIARLFADEDPDPLGLARSSQRAECEYFGKPCGLMDQTTIALGGIVGLDFAKPSQPIVEHLTFDFEACGHALCLIDVGCDHSHYTDAYAAVSEDMYQVARFHGVQVLREVDEDLFMDRLSETRATLGDRATLRAFHFFEEERLVEARIRALREGDMDGFLVATRASGASSAQYLQNVSCGGDDQPAMVALALASRLLEGSGACRIHGGGFGGSIQAYVPVSRLKPFTAGMEAVFGPGSCQRLTITPEGARAEWL